MENEKCDICKSQNDLISIDSKKFSFVICQNCYEAVLENEKTLN